MAKKIQLSISDPCHENWDAMTPVEKGKFCGSCQKQVVDFSNMSDRQIAEFFKKPSTGSVCGRFMNDQLERDIDIPKKRIPWFKYFFSIALPAFILSIKGSAQRTKGEVGVNTVRTDTTTNPYPIKMGLVAPCVKPEVKLKGTLDLIVVDEKGASIQYASIQSGVIGKGGVTNKDGLFIIDKSFLKIDGKIFISAGGFEKIELPVRTIATADSYKVILREKGWMEEIVVTGYSHKVDRRMLGAVTMVSAEQLQIPVINGKVVDEYDKPLENVVVVIARTKIGVITDKNGEFSIRPGSDQPLILVASYVGYSVEQKNLDRSAMKDKVIFRLTRFNEIMGDVIIVRKPTKKELKNVPLMPANNKTAVNPFKVFPNPVEAGTELNIEWKDQEEGYYTLNIISQSGQSVHQQELWIDADAKFLNIEVPQVSSGNYVLAITEKKSGKTFSDKVIIR